MIDSPEFHPEAIYRKALARGLDYLSITDHDTMDAYDIIGWERENLVPGVELTLIDPVNVGHTLHINIYELNKAQFLECKLIAEKDRNLITLVDFLRDQQLPYVYNHPFWFSKHDRRPNYKSIAEIAPLFPVLEYNMKQIGELNRMVLWMGKKFGKGIAANTDTHLGEVGDTRTLARGDDFRSYFESIARGDSLIVPRDMCVNALTREIETWINTIFRLNGDCVRKLKLTGVRMVDNLIHFFAASRPGRYPYSFYLLENGLKRLVRTRIFAGIYLRAQAGSARRIGQALMTG